MLGPSGSGKSTLLRAVAGLQPLDGGRILLDGADLAGVPPHRRGVGLMFQDHALFPHRDVAGNVGFGLRMQGRPAPEIADARGRAAGPGRPSRHRPARRPHALRRGAAARGAGTSARAPARRCSCSTSRSARSIERSATDSWWSCGRCSPGSGQTVVAVTHDQDEAFALADRIVVMDDGAVLRHGRPVEVWGQPVTRRVAELLGLANLVDVVVHDGSAQTPWGPVALDGRPDGPATVLVRAGEIRIEPTGTVVGTVASSTFQGDRVVLEVTVDGAPPLVVHVEPRGAPIVGATVRLAVGPDAVVPLVR